MEKKNVALHVDDMRSIGEAEEAERIAREVIASLGPRLDSIDEHIDNILEAAKEASKRAAIIEQGAYRLRRIAATLRESE